MSTTKQSMTTSTPNNTSLNVKASESTASLIEEERIIAKLTVKTLSDKLGEKIYEKFDANSQDRGAVILKNWITLMQRAPAPTTDPISELIKYIQGSTIEEIQEEFLQKFHSLPISKSKKPHFLII